MKSNFRPILLGLLLGSLMAVTAGLAHADGKIHDTGLWATAPSAHAHEVVGAFAPAVGQWKVDLELVLNDSTTIRSQGHALIHWFNRGHGIQERLEFPEFPGGARHLNWMLVAARSDGHIMRGEADSWRMSARVEDGEFLEDGSAIVLYDAGRPGGAGKVRMDRTTLRFGDDGISELVHERSADLGQSWELYERRSYERIGDGIEGVELPEGIGEAAEGLAEEASQFDFLLGEWDAQHWMLLNGRELQWPARGTGVRSLGGYAVLEHNWMDVDPNLPDAATTILRLYNPAQRRWECIYTTNRFGTILYFGGHELEGEMQLWNFTADLQSGPIPRYRFHDIEDDSFQWTASNRTLDSEWSDTWRIGATRRPN